VRQPARRESEEVGLVCGYCGGRGGAEGARTEPRALEARPPKTSIQDFALNLIESVVTCGRARGGGQRGEGAGRGVGGGSAERGGAREMSTRAASLAGRGQANREGGWQRVRVSLRKYVEARRRRRSAGPRPSRS